MKNKATGVEIAFIIFAIGVVLGLILIPIMGTDTYITRTGTLHRCNETSKERTTTTLYIEPFCFKNWCEIKLAVGEEADVFDKCYTSFQPGFIENVTVNMASICTQECVCPDNPCVDFKKIPNSHVEIRYDSRIRHDYPQTIYVKVSYDECRGYKT